jgi:hypothetical protein
MENSNLFVVSYVLETLCLNLKISKAWNANKVLRKITQALQLFSAFHSS